MKTVGFWVAIFMLLITGAPRLLDMLWSVPEPSEVPEIVAEDSANDPRSSLVANLPSDLPEANREFARRISNRFPVGSPQADLVAALSAEGFVKSEAYVDPGGPVLGNGPFLSRQRREGRCTLIWVVGWNTDDEQNLSKVNAGYTASCW